MDAGWGTPTKSSAFGRAMIYYIYRLHVYIYIHKYLYIYTYIYIYVHIILSFLSILMLKKNDVELPAAIGLKKGRNESNANFHGWTQYPSPQR